MDRDVVSQVVSRAGRSPAEPAPGVSADSSVEMTHREILEAPSGLLLVPLRTSVGNDDEEGKQ